MLIKQWTVWKQKHFKVNINNKDLGVTAISSIFNIKWKNREDIIKDDARYELLAEIFWSDNEKLQAFKKNLDNPITPSKLKTSITQTYWNWDKDKALDFLVKQWVEWKQKHFKVNINDKDLGIKSISSIFDIKRDNHNNLYKDDARYELLAKIFDKTIEDIQKLVDKKSKYN